MSGFSYIGKEIRVTTPSGRTFCVAEAQDQYWADKIVYALELDREMECM